MLRWGSLAHANRMAAGSADAVGFAYSVNAVDPEEPGEPCGRCVAAGRGVEVGGLVPPSVTLRGGCMVGVAGRGVEVGGLVPPSVPRGALAAALVGVAGRGVEVGGLAPPSLARGALAAALVGVVAALVPVVVVLAAHWLYGGDWWWALLLPDPGCLAWHSPLAGGRLLGFLALSVLPARFLLEFRIYYS